MQGTGTQQPRTARAAPFCGCFRGSYKMVPGKDRVCAPPPPAQGGGAEAAAAPLSGLGPPGERLGQERGWCSSSCAPRPGGGGGGVSSRIGFLSPLTSPVLERGWGGHLKMLSIDI